VLTGGLDFRAVLWDVSDRVRPRAVAELPGHVNFVSSVAFGPAGLTAMTSSFEGKVRVWLVMDPLHPRLLTTVTDTGGGAAFSPDGRTALSAHFKRTAALWDLDALRRRVDDPVAVACDIAGRGLDRQEWRRYAADLPFERTCIK
jgi:WD40 repeat protein